MKKITTIILTLLLATLFAWSQEVDNNSNYEHLVKYLKNNKDFLQYKKVGVFNDSGMKSVEIVTQKNRQKDIIEAIGKYKSADSNITVISATDVKITVMFRYVPMVKEKMPEKCPGKVKVQIKELMSETLKVYYYGKNMLKPANMVEVKSEVKGKVLRIESPKGTAVKAGDVVLRFDSSTITTDLKKAEANAAAWKRKLKRRKGWKVRSKKAEATAQKRVDAAEAKVADLKKMIDNNSVRSSIDGVVEEIKVDEATEYEAGTTVAVVVNRDKMKVNSGLAEGKVNNGTYACVRVEGKPVKGAMDNGHIILDNSGGKLEAGKEVNFRVFKRAYENIAIVDSAIIGKDDVGNYVYIVEPVKRKRAKRVPVTVIASDSGLTAVDGIKAGDELIIKGLACLKDGKKIRIVEMDAETGELVKAKSKKSGKRLSAKKTEKKMPAKKKKMKVMAKPETEASEWHKMKIGANFSYHSMSDGNFKDVYGTGQVTFGLDMGYMITDRIEAWGSVAFGSKSETLEDGTDTKFKFKPTVAVDLRYHFFRKNNLSIFAGGGLSIYSFEDDVNTVGRGDASTTVIGGNLLAGLQYKLGKSFYLQGIFRYNFASKSDDEWDKKLDLGSGEVVVGIGYGF